MDLPRTSLEEMRREIREIQANTVVAPSMKLSDFVSAAPETKAAAPAPAPTPAHKAPAPAPKPAPPSPVFAPAPAPKAAPAPAPVPDFDLFAPEAPAGGTTSWDPFDGMCV